MWHVTLRLGERVGQHMPRAEVHLQSFALFQDYQTDSGMVLPPEEPKRFTWTGSKQNQTLIGYVRQAKYHSSTNSPNGPGLYGGRYQRQSGSHRVDPHTLSTCTASFPPVRWFCCFNNFSHQHLLALCQYPHLHHLLFEK